MDHASILYAQMAAMNAPAMTQLQNHLDTLAIQDHIRETITQAAIKASVRPKEQGDLHVNRQKEFAPAAFTKQDILNICDHIYRPTGPWFDTSAPPDRRHFAISGAVTHPTTEGHHYAVLHIYHGTPQQPRSTALASSGKQCQTEAQAMNSLTDALFYKGGPADTAMASYALEKQLLNRECTLETLHEARRMIHTIIVAGEQNADELEQRRRQLARASLHNEDCSCHKAEENEKNDSVDEGKQEARPQTIDELQQMEHHNRGAVEFLMLHLPAEELAGFWARRITEIIAIKKREQTLKQRLENRAFEKVIRTLRDGVLGLCHVARNEREMELREAQKRLQFVLKTKDRYNEALGEAKAVKQQWN